ncbi:MAG: hypothetical protein K2P81_03010 [Bacteriovoracaceae bacterium]|nr:hypothetical protein [Bacteriovoracaceae bacterium]
MKNKNPLYVVKGKNVEQAANFFDMLLKKFDLEPVFNFLQQIFAMLLQQVQNYPMFLVIKGYIDQLFVQLMPILQQVSGMFAKA